MAKQKITSESRLRTENTMLKEQSAGLEKEKRFLRQEIAGRDAALAEVQHQLAVSERERTLAEERLECLETTVLAQSRFMSALQGVSEELRFPEPKRG